MKKSFLISVILLGLLFPITCEAARKYVSISNKSNAAAAMAEAQRRNPGWIAIRVKQKTKKTYGVWLHKDDN